MVSYRHRLSAACLAFVAMQAPPASAASPAYLRSNGGGNTCTLTTPCANMTGALAVAGAGGEVICLDKGNYSGGFQTSINLSVTISCGDGFWECPDGVIFINTGVGENVVIEGLVLNGAATGLNFTGSAGSLHLRKVRVGNSAGGFGKGLAFRPGGPATLHVSDSVFNNNSDAGILVQPGPGGYANVHIRNVRFERNLHGLFADGSQSTIGINVNISDSLAAENLSNGFLASTIVGKAPVNMSVMNTHISGNLSTGLTATGATISVAGSMITANAIGLSAGFGGQIRTAGNNMLQHNGTSGGFTGTFGLQ